MKIGFHPHAMDRMSERGATLAEVERTVLEGESFPAKFDRTGFRRNFSFGEEWRGVRYGTKQVEAFAAKEDDGWMVITVIVRYY